MIVAYFLGHPVYEKIVIENQNKKKLKIE